jgi:phage terminase large subunit-like protein
VLKSGVEREGIRELIQELEQEVKKLNELLKMLELCLAYEEVSKEDEELVKDWDITISDGLDDE